MMEDISNRTLAIILIVAILISFVGTLFGMARLTTMTGVRAPKVFVPLINAMATSVATVNLSVVEATSVNWSVTGLNWSQGRVDANKAGCTIDSAGNTGASPVGSTTNNCTADPFEGEDGAVSNGINLTNQGNTNVTLNISTSADANGFIGGTGVVAKWNVSDAFGTGAAGEDVCSVARGGYSGFGASSYTAFSATHEIICNATDKLRPDVGNNTLRVDFVFVIPSDSPTGSKQATVTATYVKETAAFN